MWHSCHPERSEAESKDPFPWDERERIPPRGFALVGMTGFLHFCVGCYGSEFVAFREGQEPPLRSLLNNIYAAQKGLPGDGQVFPYSVS